MTLVDAGDSRDESDDGDIVDRHRYSNGQRRSDRRRAVGGGREALQGTLVMFMAVARPLTHSI